MGMNYQLTVAGFDVSKAMRQFQRADKAFSNENDDRGVKHLKKGFELLGKAYDHLVQADEDAYNKAGEEIGKGNTQLEKSIDSYASGNDDSGDRHYEKALDHYDNALDLIA